MLAPLLILQLALATPARDSIYSSPALRDFIAVAADANRLPPPTLLAYRGRVESELSLLVRDTIGRERVAQVEQVAMRASWDRGGDYDLRVIGYRSQTVGVPYSALSIARSWTIPFLYGDRLTLGVDVGEAAGVPRRARDSMATPSASPPRRAPDTLHAVHPLALDRDRFYRFSGGDTIAVLQLRGRNVPLVRVHVRPDFDSAARASRIAAFHGEIDFDGVRHQIVRMRGEFVGTEGPRRRGLSMARLPGIVAVAYVEFVNAEVDGQYWLPAFQRSEFQATFAPLGVQRSIFRLVSRFVDLDVAQRFSVTDSIVAGELGRVPDARSSGYHRRLSFASSDSVSGYHDWLQPLGAATTAVSGSDFDDLAPDPWRATGAPRLEVAPTTLGQVFRFNRVEGLYSGLAASERFRDAVPGLTAHAYGGWAWSEGTPRGGASLAYHVGSVTTTARAERVLASTNDFVPPLEDGSEGFGALFGGIDEQDYVDRRSGALSLTRTIGTERGALVVLESGLGDDRSERARLDRSPLGVGHFRQNRGSLDGRYVRASTTIELHPDVTGLFLEPGMGAIASYEIAGGELRWQRAELTVAARRNLSNFVIDGRVQGGLLLGRVLPPQQLFELGGENALPGYDYKEFAGDRAAAAGVLTAYTFPVLRRPWRLVRALMLPGLSPGLAAGIQGGWTEASNAAARLALRRLDPGFWVECAIIDTCEAPISTPTHGIRATADARLTFFGGLVGVGVARPIDQSARWRLAFRFAQEY